MKSIQTLVRVSLSLVVVSLASVGAAQGLPTATQQLQLSAFGAATGTFTDLYGGKNLAITAGVDLTVLHYRLLRPSIEVRGSYPVDRGTISSQKDILAGVKVEHEFGRLHPYADFLIGRGEIDYDSSIGTFPYLGLRVVSSTSTVYSPGVGLDYDVSHHLALKGDAQFQHWNTSLLVFPPGTIYPVAVSAGLVYRFDFNRYHHRAH